MLLWADDFNSYGDDISLMLDGLYAQVDAGDVELPFDPDPTVVNRRVLYLHFDNATVRKALSVPAVTVGMAMRVWLDQLPPATDQTITPMQFRDAANLNIAYIRINTTGTLSVHSQDGTVISTTSSTVIIPHAWMHIEALGTFDVTVGSLEVRVNGITVLTITNEPLLGTAAGCAQIAMKIDDAPGGFNTPLYIKDFVLYDGTGTENNDFLGTVQVIRLVPTSDVSFNWTPSTGTTGFDLINETPPDDDTSYISAADPPPAASSFGLTDLPDDVTSVRGLMTLVRARKADGGDGNLQVSLTSGGSDDAGLDRPITSAYTYWFDVSELDPATSLAWTPAAVDAATIKIDRTV